MQEINKLLDKCKQLCLADSDSALARELGVGRAAVSGWRHGVRLPDPVACAKIAEISGEPLAKILGIVGEARALSSAEKAVWRRLAAAAALILWASVPLTWSEANARGLATSHNVYNALKFWLSSLNRSPRPLAAW